MSLCHPTSPSVDSALALLMDIDCDDHHLLRFAFLPTLPSTDARTSTENHYDRTSDILFDQRRKEDVEWSVYRYRAFWGRRSTFRKNKKRKDAYEEAMRRRRLKRHHVAEEDKPSDAAALLGMGLVATSQRKESEAEKLLGSPLMWEDNYY